MNTAGAVALSVSGAVIRDNSASSVDEGLRLLAQGTAQISATISGSSFAGHRGTGVSATTAGSGIMPLNLSGGALRGNNVGVSLAHGSSGSFTFNIRNVPSITASSSPINVNRLATAGAASLFAGTVSGNVIGTAGLTNSGSSVGAPGCAW